MKTSILFFFVLTLFFQNACGQWGVGQKVRGNGNLVTKTRNVPDYDAIAVSGSFEVELVSGQEGNLSILAESNLMEYIVTKVENGTLKIKTKNRINLRTQEDIKIIVPFQDIDEISFSGSGALYSSHKITAKDFNLNLSGSGEVAIVIEVEELDTDISGSGEIALKGVANNLEIALSGSGEVDASQLKANMVEVGISGSGDVQVFAKQSLEAEISGSGDIKYSGNPEKEDFSTSGSGSVSKN